MLPFAKLTFGIGRPWKARILGTELAGEVEAVGNGVTRFKRGDRIVASTGMAGGGHAQYVCLPEKGALALKSESLTWEEAVAIPFGANTALYFSRNLGKIQAGQELLIIGASRVSARQGCNWPNTLGQRPPPCAVARTWKW
jgi:NADPH:quinone reductase-like Zn-dependent oxidoreductase